MSEPKPRIKIFIRNVTGKLPAFGNDRNGCPDDYRNGKWYYVEAHARELIGWWGPVALGTVNVISQRAYLHSIIVVDGARQKRLAQMIVESAGKRWPAIYWHGCGDSAEFHARLVAKGIAARREGLDIYDFVPREKRSV